MSNDVYIAARLNKFDAYAYTITSLAVKQITKFF